MQAISQNKQLEKKKITLVLPMKTITKLKQRALVDRRSFNSEATFAIEAFVEATSQTAPLTSAKALFGVVKPLHPEMNWKQQEQEAKEEHTDTILDNMHDS